MCARSSRTRPRHSICSSSSSCGQAPIPQTPGDLDHRPREAFQLGARTGGGCGPPSHSKRIVRAETPGGTVSAAITSRGPGSSVATASDSRSACRRAGGSSVLRPAAAHLARRRLDHHGPGQFLVRRVRQPSAPRSRRLCHAQRPQRPRVDARTALLGGEQIVTDTTLATRWQRVRRLAAQPIPRSLTAIREVGRLGAR